MNCYKFLPGHVVYFNQRTCANGGQNCLHQCFNIFFHHKWKKELGDTFKRFLTPKRCSTPEEIIILCTTPNVKTIDFDKSVNMNYFQPDYILSYCNIVQQTIIGGEYTFFFSDRNSL